MLYCTYENTTVLSLPCRSQRIDRSIRDHFFRTHACARIFVIEFVKRFV